MIEQNFRKGTGNRDDGYSASEATNLNLERYLYNHDVTDLYIAGLTTEYCVKTSALDAERKGFKMFVVTNAIAGIMQHPGDVEEALAEMKAAGVQLVTSMEAIGISISPPTRVRTSRRQ
jgi:nicotinamidase/pyrazinamidase